MRLLLAPNLSHKGLVTHLQQRHRQVTQQRAALKRVLQEADPPSNSGQVLAFDYGMAIADTELAWLEDLIAALEAQCASQEFVGKGN